MFQTYGIGFHKTISVDRLHPHIMWAEENVLQQAKIKTESRVSYPALFFSVPLFPLKQLRVNRPLR